MRSVATHIRDLPDALREFLGPDPITTVNVCTWFEVRCSGVDPVVVWGREYAELLFVSACEELRPVLSTDTRFWPEIPAVPDCLNDFTQVANALAPHLLTVGGREDAPAVVGVVRCTVDGGGDRLPDVEVEIPDAGATQLLHRLLSQRLRKVTDATRTT